MRPLLAMSASRPVPPVLQREVCASVDEWRRIVGLVRPAARLHAHEPRADFEFAGARVELTWSVLPPRPFGRLRLPRLAVRFDLSALRERDRERFLEAFDQQTRRGGG